MKYLALIFFLFNLSSSNHVLLETTEKSSLTVAGTSTLHGWHMTSTDVDADAVLYTTDEGFEVESFRGSIEVESLKSGKKGLDKNAYKTLNTKEYKTIQFNLTEVIEKNREEQRVTGLFDITVSGVTKQMQISANTETIGQDSVRLSGSKELKMTDFDIDPPSFVFGTLKTGNDITVSFDLRLSAKEHKD